MPFEVYKKERIDLTKYDLVFHNLNLPLSVKKKHVSDNKNKVARENKVFLAVLVILLLNIAAKKIAAFYLESEIEIKDYNPKTTA